MIGYFEVCIITRWLKNRTESFYFWNSFRTSKWEMASSATQGAHSSTQVGSITLESRQCRKKVNY